MALRPFVTNMIGALKNSYVFQPRTISETKLQQKLARINYYFKNSRPINLAEKPVLPMITYLLKIYTGLKKWNY